MRGPDNNIKFVAGVGLGVIAGVALWELVNSKDGKELVKRVTKPFETTAKHDEKPVEEKPVVADVKAKPMEGGRADGESRTLVQDDSLDE